MDTDKRWKTINRGGIPTTDRFTYTDILTSSPGDPPPPVAPVGALGGFHVLPGHQRQQRHRGRGRLVEFHLVGPASVSAARTAFASVTSAETSACLASGSVQSIRGLPGWV